VFDWLSPLTRRVFGPEFNRDTESNVRAAGLEIMDARQDGIWCEIVARPARTPVRVLKADAAGAYRQELLD
jgi:hypothetical protein